jgi:UDP-4-amino-4,6-dideoxy-N-acetyl-beta-L-altrosamine transaminase
VNAVVPIRRLPYGRQSIDAGDLAAVAAALQSDFLTTGPLIAQFEKALCEATGSREAIAVANGTAALHMAARAAGLTEGTWTVVPSNTFLATANAVRLTGGEVVFADVDPATGLMTPETFEAALRTASGPVKAAIPVHFSGPSADMPGIARIANARGVTLIEDAAHAIGTTTPHGRVGSNRNASMTCFSFHPVKTMTTGEGGAVTTNDPALARALRRDRSHGMTRETAEFLDAGLSLDHTAQANPWAYEMHAPGLNYRITDIQAALGLSQLRKLEAFVDARARLKAIYDAAFAGSSPHVETPVYDRMQKPAWHLYAVRIDFAALKKSRSDVMRRLLAEGIGTQVHYIPVHRQPYYQARYGRIDLRGAQTHYERTLSLPLYPDMTDDDAAFVAVRLKAALGL